MRGLSAPLISLQMTPREAGLLIWSGVGRLCSLGRINALSPTMWHSRSASARSDTWVMTTQQPHAVGQAWGGVAAKLLSREGPGGVGQQPNEQVAKEANSLLACIRSKSQAWNLIGQADGQTWQSWRVFQHQRLKHTKKQVTSENSCFIT